MTTGESGPLPLRPRRSAAWNLAWRAIYRTMRALDPLVRSWVANDLPGLNGVVEMRFVGRRSGRPRRILITLLSLDRSWYVGHPNGEASWVRNSEASGWVDIEPPGHHGPRFSVHRLAAGPERDAVIRATVRQQPFPANLVYRASQRHVAAVGVYHRLEPVPTDNAATGNPGERVMTSRFWRGFADMHTVDVHELCIRGGANVVLAREQDQQARRDRARPPADPPGCVPGLALIPGDGPLNPPEIVDFRLDLSAEEGPINGSEREEVDPTAISTNPDLDFEPDLPPGRSEAARRK